MSKTKAGTILTLAILALLSTGVVSIGYGQHVVPRPDRPAAVDEAIMAEIIDSVSAVLNEIYVFPDVAANMEKHIRDRFKEKAYDDITNCLEFTDTLTADLRSICHDLHLWVRWFPEERLDLFREDSLTDAEKQERQRRASYENFGFQKIERLSGNIGYLDLRSFTGAATAGATAIAAMNFLAHSDAIIVDLRQNGGGSPSMIQLISSYFFEEPVHLNSFYVRAQDTIEQFWTQAYVQGPKMVNTDLYILTSDYTFSGAEEFTYNMKNLERATIIGDTTGGGAHPVEFHTFANLGVVLKVPFGRAINPITGTNWEGTGIVPDIVVPQEEALDVARYEAMKKLAEKETNPEIKQGLDWAVSTLDALRNPATVDEQTLISYAGSYGPRVITFEDGELYYQREGRSKYRMIPMNDNIFVFEELDFFRLAVMKDSSGQITHLEGLYSDGHTDTSPKDGS